MAEQVVIESENHHITKSAGVVAFFTALSRVLGLVRDTAIFHVFGAASGVTDAFFVAFTIPNSLRRIVGEGALTVAFIPVYTEVRHRHGDQEAKKFLAATLALLLSVLITILAVGMLAAKWVVLAFASGFASDPEKLALATSLTRWLFPYVFFISLVALAMGVLNTHRRFTAPAASPILLNAAMIISTLFFSDLFDEPIFAVVTGALIGGVLQLLLQLPALGSLGLLVRPKWDLQLEPLRKLLKMMIPAVFGIAIYQINIIILRQLGSYLPAGQISYYYTADRLMEFALGIFGFSIATATLPSMSRQRVNNDLKGMIKTWRFAVQLTNFITIPSAAGLFLIATPVVSVLFLHGAYTWADAQQTGYTTMAFAMGLISVALTRTTVQAFYALENMRTPVLTGLVTVVLNLFFGIVFLDLGSIGLGLALSLSSWAQSILLLGLLRHKVGPLGGTILLSSMIKQGLLACVAAIAAWGVTQFFDWSYGPTFINVGGLGLALGVAVAIYAGGALLFKFEEAIPIKEMVLRKLRR